MSPGELLRARRKKKKLTQRELAGLVGVSTSSISRLEAGNRSFDGFEIVLSLCRELGIKPEDLVNAA